MNNTSIPSTGPTPSSTVPSYVPSKPLPYVAPKPPSKSIFSPITDLFKSSTSTTTPTGASTGVIGGRRRKSKRKNPRRKSRKHRKSYKK